MPSILFHIAPAVSHFYSSFKIAKPLQNSGYKIIYIGIEMFRSVVEEAGYKYELLDNFASHHYNLEKEGLIKSFYNCFISRIKKQHNKISKSNIYPLEKRIKEISPDLVFIDVQIISLSIYYQQFGFKVATVCMMPFPGKDTLVPPFNSRLIPKQKLIYKLYINYLWFKIKTKNWLSLLFSKLISFGLDEITTVKRFASETGFEFKELFDYSRVFVFGFKHLNEFVLVPKYFDFPRPDLQNVHFIGLGIERYRENDITNVRYMSVIEYIKNIKTKDKTIKLIYCSLGTLTSLNMKKAERFFKKIALLSPSFAKCYFILSLGESYDIQKLLPIPHNMFVFTRVPQIDILSYTDIMITHGGMNSILECIEMEVPMLVYPLSKKWDQPGNSARVVYHRLGLRGDINHDSTRTIAKKISELNFNQSYYKTNVSKMKEKFERNSRQDEVVKLIEVLIEN